MCREETSPHANKLQHITRQPWERLPHSRSSLRLCAKRRHKQTQQASSSVNQHSRTMGRLDLGCQKPMLLPCQLPHHRQLPAGLPREPRHLESQKSGSGAGSPGMADGLLWTGAKSMTVSFSESLSQFCYHCYTPANLPSAMLAQNTSMSDRDSILTLAAALRGQCMDCQIQIELCRKEWQHG